MSKKSEAKFKEWMPVVDRPWGYYYILGNGPRWLTKVLVVKPEQSTSMQLHLHRTETYLVVEGVADISMNGDIKTLYEGHIGWVTPGTWHQITNTGKIDLVIVETWMGSYLNEDDIERK